MVKKEKKNHIILSDKGFCRELVLQKEKVQQVIKTGSRKVKWADIGIAINRCSMRLL